MTQLKPSSALVRETAVYYRGRALLVALWPGYLEIRPKGKRQGFAISYAAIFECAAKLVARQAAAEKTNCKLARRKR